tara:strand:- start:124 stop:948 length:825 start_codon:yes stop_codon:yes gene_type:complete
MGGKLNDYKMVLIITLSSLLLASATIAESDGITGDKAEGDSDVAKNGCTCHSNNQIAPSDSVTLILDGAPFMWSEGTSYPLTIQLIGGPEITSGSNTGGFSMLVSAGTLEAGTGYESLVDNDGSEQTITHTSSGAKVSDRIWQVVWTAPSTGNGEVSFWLSGNSVDGNGAPMAPDAYNRLSFILHEGSDDGNTRMIFAGDGNIQAPAAESGHVDLHSMGAPFRAHWLGLLGFGAVISVVIFCGFFLRYGFSRHYSGRTSLLRLRMKHLQRGDQV